MTSFAQRPPRPVARAYTYPLPALILFDQTEKYIIEQEQNFTETNPDISHIRDVSSHLVPRFQGTHTCNPPMFSSFEM